MFAHRLSIALIVWLALAGAADAAAAKGAKKYFIPPAPRAIDAGLKGAAPIAAPPAAGLRTGASTLSVSTLVPAASTLSRGMSGLPAVGGSAPICRAACAQARYSCLAVDDEACDTGWTRCVAGCGS